MAVVGELRCTFRRAILRRAQRWTRIAAITRCLDWRALNPLWAAWMAMAACAHAPIAMTLLCCDVVSPQGAQRRRHQHHIDRDDDDDDDDDGDEHGR